MTRRAERPAPDDGPSAPLWLVSFSDCMTNLLTFFVLLVTFSAFEQDIPAAFGSMARGMRKAFFGSVTVKGDPSAVQRPNPVWAVEEVTRGSEKPTLLTGEDARAGSLKQTPGPVDAADCKVFLAPSKKMFLGRSAILSVEGKYLMGLMAQFLGESPAKVVISEYGNEDGPRSIQSGLQRAWELVEHLTTQYHLDPARFSIAAATTRLEQTPPVEPSPQRERMVEIILVERSIHE